VLELGSDCVAQFSSTDVLAAINLTNNDTLIDFKKFIVRDFYGTKMIAHCENNERQHIKKAYQAHTDAVILIGPEGDFSPEEIEMAINKGFIPISLGNSRLRTETAALMACHTIHIIND
jgi:16S rRNA (uracil1498-N3)-methyltransferase